MKQAIGAMAEAMPIPEQPPEARGGAQRDEVPVDLLSMPDEEEQMTPPEVGDEVNYTVTGKVVRITGGRAVIERKTINGQDLGGNSMEPESGDEGLEAEARGLDQGGAGY
jgi:hypothetical protein